MCVCVCVCMCVCMCVCVCAVSLPKSYGVLTSIFPLVSFLCQIRYRTSYKDPGTECTSVVGFSVMAGQLNRYGNNGAVVMQLMVHFSCTDEVEAQSWVNFINRHLPSENTFSLSPPPPPSLSPVLVCQSKIMQFF